MFTDSNRPICIKCKEKPALTLIDNMWVCGDCLSKYINQQIKLKQDMFLSEW